MRRVRRRGGNKEKVFGCDLLEHLTASCQDIPQVLRSCSEFVEQHGIVDGIYRLSGVSSNIQKLRSEFDSDGSPDLNKDVYLQDIHCVSSLCKAYFRELPNPLLTYQLYDKFADAVAIQLEEERLVKIADVLKELPQPHYRTLEFLMRHLVRVASHSSETNMHARNLAIVWAPNLLRSKDIEASGFNGTAAFMEVRVQSIVVEFILTHVPQLFPEQGVSQERRKSLPSPTALSNQEEPFFKSSPSQSPSSFGNISPGDGPLRIRPYHAIIEGTDKRKGSLKGRKWMSIFNIGGRFHDPRRRNKNSTKEKERHALRPARSMDSLSPSFYPNEGSRHPAQRPPSSNMSALVTPPPQAGTEAGASAGGMGSSGYAVTYRRGTGVVGGGGGTQGTYHALDPDGLGATGSEGQPYQSRSPGLSTKAGRRAAMHISGPHLVTVPLHITSNLALGVLQGGGGDRVIHCGRDKDGGDKGESKEGGEKVEQREMERKEKSGKVDAAEDVKEDKNDGGNAEDKEEAGEGKESKDAEGGGVEEKEEGVKEEEEKEEDAAREYCRLEMKLAEGGGGESGGQGAEHLNSNTEDDSDGDSGNSDEYMEMKGGEPDAAAAPQFPTSEASVCLSNVSDILNSTEVDGNDQELFGYVQDNFDFLDHMDCSVSNQMNEFSVEPPGHEDDEYEVMEEHMSSHFPQDPFGLQTPPSPPTHLQPELETDTQVQTELNSHRPLSADGRHVKSLSLPYRSTPFLPAQISSEEDVVDDDNDDEDDYSDEDDESMFYKSLPCSYSFHDMTWPGLVTDARDVSSPFPQSPQSNSQTVDRLPADQSQSSEGRQPEPPDTESSACTERAMGNQEQGEVKDEGELKEEQAKEEEEDQIDQEEDQAEKHMQTQSSETEYVADASIAEDDAGDPEKSGTAEPSTTCSVEFPRPRTEDIHETGTVVDTKVNDEREVVENPCSDGQTSAGHFDDTTDTTTCHTVSCVAQKETVDVSRKKSVRATEQPQVRGEEEGESDEGEEDKVEEEIEDKFRGGEEGQGTRPETDVDEEVVKQHDENKQKEPIEGGSEGEEHEEQAQQGGREQDDGVCGMSFKVWDEFQEAVCEIIEIEESMKAGECVNGEGDTIGDVVKVEEEEDQMKTEKVGVPSEEMKVSEEGMTREEEEEVIVKAVKTEVVEEMMETLFIDEKDLEMQQDSEKQEIHFPKRSESDDGSEEGDREIQEMVKEEEKMPVPKHSREEGGSEKQEKEKEDQGRAKEAPQSSPSEDEKEKDLKEVRSDVRESNEGKREESDRDLRSEAGVGRKLMISKQGAAKVYQVKSVPVVPPKPQHCRLTALSLRQQQQQKERRDADRERENATKVTAEQDKKSEKEAKTEQDKSCVGKQGKDGAGEHEGTGKKERQVHKGGEREKRREGDEGGVRDTTRNSPLSMCFDEAVAIATMRRGREKECEKERERQRDWGYEAQ